MDFSSYRLSYLKSIICSSIISTTVICIILSFPCFSDSTSTGSTSGSIFVSSSSSSPYSPNWQLSSSSRHHYYLKQQQKAQESPNWNPQTRSWTSATFRDTAAYFNGRGISKSRRRLLYHTHLPSIPIYGGNDAEDMRDADPDNYDAQRAVFLRYRQRLQSSRVSDLRTRSKRWVVETLFKSQALLDREDIYDDDWDDQEDEEEEDEYEDEDYDFREGKKQEEAGFDVGEAEETKDKESRTLDTILRQTSTSSCPWIPQWTRPTRKYNHLHHQQVRCRLRRLYPKHNILVDSQPHQQQDQLSRQPISHKQFSPRSRTRMTRTWRLESIHPQRPDRQQQHHYHYNKHNRQNKHLHTAGGRHSRRPRNGRRPSSSGLLTSACTSFLNRIFSHSSPSSFLSTFIDCRRIWVAYLSNPTRLAKSFKGAMDTLLFFLSDLPNGFSFLLHQDFVSALFSTAPPTTSTRFSHQDQHHASFSSWFSNYDHYGSNNVHGPQRIPPHPLLEMAASNIPIRLGLLVILCLGAFYYCVTTMEQQQRQIAGVDGGAGSNWLADPVPATSTTATNSNSTTASTSGVATTATENHPRRSLSDLYPSVTGAFTTAASNVSLGSTRRATARGVSTRLTPGMTAAEVMASLGRSVNNLEQLRRQQLQQQRLGSQILNLTLVNGVHTDPESADSTTTTPSTPASITATLISALIRSTATAMAFTCGTANHPHSHMPPYSASTTPALPCSNVFSGSEKVADDKPSFEPEWKENTKDGDIDHKVQKKKDSQQDVRQSAYKEKQKGLDNNNQDDDETIYQSEQEYGRFSTTGLFDTEDDTLREYRNMMYYSSNYPFPYGATFGSGGGESSRSNSRRSSIFMPSPSPPAPVLDQVTAAATTAVVSHISETQGLVEVEEEEEEEEKISPFWNHFYTLDALQSFISHRLSTTAAGRPSFVPSHQLQQCVIYSRPSPRRKWTSNKARPRNRMTTRSLPNRSPTISKSSSIVPSASILSPSSSRSVSVLATTSSTLSSRRHRARKARQQSLLQ